jgi:hypothetical protein
MDRGRYAGERLARKPHPRRPILQRMPERDEAGGRTVRAVHPATLARPGGRNATWRTPRWGETRDVSVAHRLQSADAPPCPATARRPREVTLMRWIRSAVLALCLAAPALADAPTYYGFPVGVSDAPPLERLELEEPARIVRVEGSDIFTVGEPGCDPDVFRFGLSWFVYTGTHWYRSTSLSGPFRAIDVRLVPRPVLQLPAHRWKRHPLAAQVGRRRARRDGVPAAAVSSIGAMPVERSSAEWRGPRHERSRPHRNPR